MSKHLIHSVFRSYIALARGEHFSPSELGETLDFIGAYSGRLVHSEPLCQINYFADEQLETAIEKRWKRDARAQFEAGIIANPGRLANRIICAKLVKVYGRLNERVPQFDKDDLLNIPRRAEIIVPVRCGNLIESLAFSGGNLGREKV